MRLLLTSAGVTNQLIADALVALTQKKPHETKIGFITTAKNIESGNAAWFYKKLGSLFQYGFTDVDLVDPSAADVDWRHSLIGKDVILVGGGNTFHLLNQVRLSGFDTWLRENLETKVYVGISAGSILVTPSIAVASVGEGDINVPNISDLTGLNLVNFEVSPHSPESVSDEENDRYAATTANTLYAFDDESAISVDAGIVNIISATRWRKIQQNNP